MSCCCCVTPRELLDGIREKEEEDQMDVSVLRERYRSCREAQRSRAQVLLLRTVSEVVVPVVPVAQGLASPWEPTSPSDPDPTCDPWHVHLDLHRRCWTGGTRTGRRSESRDGGESAGSGSLSSSTETFSSSKDDGLSAGPDSDGPPPDGPPPDGPPPDGPPPDGPPPDGPPPDLGDGGGSSRKLLRRQQSVGCYPFPSRKSPRISEAARRLGMYSSF